MMANLHEFKTLREMVPEPLKVALATFAAMLMGLAGLKRARRTRNALRNQARLKISPHTD